MRVWNSCSGRAGSFCYNEQWFLLPLCFSYQCIPPSFVLIQLGFSFSAQSTQIDLKMQRLSLIINSREVNITGKGNSFLVFLVAKLARPTINLRKTGKMRKRRRKFCSRPR